MIVRYRKRAVIAALALGLAVCAGVLVAGPATAAPRGAPATASGQHFTPLKVTPASALNQPETVSNTPVTNSNCGSLRAAAAKAKKEGKQYVTCTTIGQGAPQGTAGAAPAVLPDISITSTCAQAQQDGPGIWAVSRLEECIYPEQVSFDEYEILTDGTLVPEGTAFFDLYQDIRLNASSGVFTELDTVTFASASTAAAQKSGALTVTSACGSPATCTVTPAGAPSGTTISFHQSISFGFDYRDTPSTTVPDQFRTIYDVGFLPPGYIPLSGPFNYTSAFLIRCDNQLPGASYAGCAFPAYTPTLGLSLSTFGTGAANVAIGQSVVAGAPGTPGNPLTRADPANKTTYRNRICDSTFVALASVPGDSCDEYPFASTMQSGGAKGYTGSACIDVIPTASGGTIGYTIVKGAVGAPCERGHVTLANNTNVGTGALAPFFKTERVIIGDAFYVTVTP